MTTHTALAYAPDAALPDPDPYEPDELWKSQLRERIQLGLVNLVKEAKEAQLAELRKKVVSEDDRNKLEKDYLSKMESIKQLGHEQYLHELQKERNQRRWSAGVTVDAESIKVLVKEQEQILNAIKQKNTLSSQYNTALSSSPISEQLLSNPSSPFPRPRTPESAHTRAPEANLSSPQRKQRRREAEASASADTQISYNTDKTPSRRASERRTNGTSGEHTEDQPTSSRRTNGQVHDDPWLTDLFDEPIDDRLAPRTKLPDKLQERNWDGSLSRSSGSSVRSLSLSDRGHPPRSPTHPSDGRKVAEDPVSVTAKTYPQQVHRRGSTTSMRSTGSGASIRPMTETIPERIDDVEDDVWPEAHDGEQSRRMYEKRDREKRPARRDSRAGHGDAPIRHDGPSSSMTMQYATTSTPVKALSNKSSFVSNEARERYYTEQPPPLRQPMSASYSESHDHFSTHRDHQPAYSRDSNRPPPSRSSYNSDDREYPPPPPTTRPIPSRGSYNGDDPREQDFAARDLLASRPMASRNGYSGDDREYPSPPPASTVRSPGPPRPSYDDAYSIPNASYGPSPSPRMNGISKSGGSMNGSFLERDYASPPPQPSHHGAPFGPYDDRPRWDPPRDGHWDEEREMREREAYMHDRDRLEWDKREREKRDREQRDRERERDQERGRDYDWERSHPPYHPYMTQPSRTPLYPSPPPSASLSRHESLSYAPHISNGAPARTFSTPYRETNSVPPPQDYDYPTGRTDISRQASYSSRRESDRRMEAPDPYAYAQYGRPSPSNDDAMQQQQVPAWRGWRTSPNDIVPPMNGSSPASPYPRQQAPTTPAPPRTRGPAKPKRRMYRKPPSPPELSEGPYAPTDTDSGSDDEEEGEEGEEYEYDFDETNIFSGPPARVRDSSDDGDDPRRVLDESETSEGEMRKAKARRALQKQENELRRLSAQDRRLEEETRRREEEMRAKEAELLQAKEAENRRREEEKEKARLAQVKEEAARRDAEARARAEEVQRKEEEAQRKAAEVARQAEIARLLEEDLKRKAAETRRVAEEARKIEEEAARKAVEAKKKEAEAKKKEKEVSKREQDAKRRAADARKLEEEAKRKEQELKKKEEEARKREEKLRLDAEKTKQMQEEAQMIAEQAKERQQKLLQLEEETRKREQEIKDREHALLLREMELRLREEEARRKEEEAKREQTEKEAEAKQKELEEQLRRIEEARQQEEARKHAYAQKMEEGRKRREAIKLEETRKREEEQKAQAEREERERSNIRKQRENVDTPLVFPSQEVDPRVAEEERQRESARLAREKREREIEETRNAEAARRLQDEDFVGDLDEDLLNDPKMVEEQAFIWRQFQYQRQADKIQRSRQEQRSRQDSLGETPWTSAPSSSPGKPSSIPRPPQPSQTSPQSAGPSSASSPSWGPTPSAWTSAPKPTPAASTSTQSPTPSRTPNGTHTPKPPTANAQGSARPGSFNSTNFAPGPTFDNASFDDWQRRQNDFINDQQERFRREQEKIAAEVEMRSAGKVTREDMSKVFDRHERLYTQLSEKTSLTWADFPWPMAKMPNTPDDISLPLITAYLQSPSWPDKEKHTTTKDRIKYHMKQWHPDRFDTKLLPKVTDAEKEKVRLGAGTVARYLSDLLQKENANSSNSFNL